MRKLFLPFRRARRFAFRRGISTKLGVSCASHQPFVIALSFPCLHQSLSATAVISFPVATVVRSSTPMAGKSQVLPANAWVRSSMMERKLEDLLCDGLLRPRVSQSQPEWRVPPSSHREPAPPEGYVVSFIAFHGRARDAAEPVHVGAPTLLQGAAPSPRPQLRLVGHHLCGSL
jgi:hypothetical protein